MEEEDISDDGARHGKKVEGRKERKTGGEGGVARWIFWPQGEGGGRVEGYYGARPFFGPPPPPLFLGPSNKRLVLTLAVTSSTQKKTEEETLSIETRWKLVD